MFMVADQTYERIPRISTRLMGIHSYHGTSIMIAQKAGEEASLESSWMA